MAKRVTEAQGIKVNLNTVFQNDTSTSKLAENGKISSGERNLHLGISLFHATYLISRKEVAIKHCPTGKILADYFSKPLGIKIFRMMRSDIVSIALT